MPINGRTKFVTNARLFNRRLWTPDGEKKTTRPDLLKVQIIEKVLTHCMIAPHSLLWTINVKQWPRLLLIAMKWPIVKTGICLINNNIGKKELKVSKYYFLNWLQVNQHWVDANLWKGISFYKTSLINSKALQFLNFKRAWLHFLENSWIAKEIHQN